MGIHEGKALLHWNYFLALEADIENLSRYIEFSESNFTAYSTEMAHILIASSSEVDVMAKQLCRYVNPNSKACKINQYRNELRVGFPELEDIEITLPRYALTLTPWKNWKGNTTPIWWTSHNNVKHQRDEHFKDANLKNVLNAMSALFSLVLYYYRGTIAGKRIEPPPNLFTPPPQLAQIAPTVGGRMALFYAEQR